MYIIKPFLININVIVPKASTVKNKLNNYIHIIHFTVTAKILQINTLMCDYNQPC